MAKKLLIVFFVFFLCYNNSFSQATTTTQVLTTGTSFTIPCGVTSVTVEAWGGGGAGGGSQNDNRAGGGGGGGGYVMKTFAVIAGETITYAIGTGGTGGTGNGGVGGNTTVTHTSSSTSLTANGGLGGIMANARPNAGGAGGSSSGGSVMKSGITGSSSPTNGSVGGNGGAGANGGGTGGDGQTDSNGSVGNSPGGGGGGAERSGSNRSGGAGGAGQIRITYFTPTTTTLTTTNATVCQGGTANLQALNPNTTITTFTGSWTAATDLIAVRQPSETTAANITTCGFTGNIRNYSVVYFTVNVTGSYTFKMTENGDYDGMAYITTADFEPGNCSGGGSYVMGDDDENNSGTNEPRITTNLTAGTVYKLISTTFGNTGTFTGTYIWTVTPPTGGGVNLPAATVRWYTASSGGTSIGTGASFNPVGVPGSGLANSNTPGTTTFYAAYGDACGTRMPATYTVTAVTPNGEVGTVNTFCMNSDPPVIITAPVNSGQYVSVNVVSGFTYSFAVGDVFPGASETLTILNNSNANFSPVASVTGPTGTAINTWVAPSSGVIRLVLTSSTCANGTTGGALTLTQNLLGNNFDSQTASGTNNWRGHIYNAGGIEPEPFTSANYMGYYLEPFETINQGFGGDTACFTVLSNGVQRASVYTEGYAVRYRMNTTKTGCYLATITGDDGVRLFLNPTGPTPTPILSRWQEQGSTTYSNILVNLDGNDDLVFDYYENGTNNVVGFSMIPFDAATNTITPASSTVCSGTAVTLNGSSYLINGATNPFLTFQWQASPNGIDSWTNVATTEDYAPSPTTTTYYRRQVIPNASSGCGTLTSGNVVINVATPTLNTVAQAATVCQGAAATINLTGLLPSSTSTIAYSINGTAQTAVANVVANASGNASFSTVALTATNNGQTLSVTGVTTTSSTPNCSTAFTTKTLTLSVTPTVGTPTAITISAGTQPTCQLTNGTTTTTYATTATNSTGFNWSLSNGSAGSINATTGVVSWANGFSGSVNIQVQASGCNGASAMVTRTVNISPASVAGTVSADQSLCTATTPAPITLTGNTGTIQWEVSSDNITFNPIAGATASPLTAAQMGTLTSTRYYRAVVTSGTCTAATSAVVRVATGPVTASAETAVTCTGFTANWTLVPGASGYLLDVATDNFTTFIHNGLAAGNNASHAVTGLTANTSYRYRVWPMYACGTYGTPSNVEFVTTSALTSVPAIGGGASAVCVGLTTPAFTNATPGGTWSITNGTGQATISTGGVVTGVTAGTVTVRYSITSSGGCSNTATRALTVNALPVITTQPVALAVCQGASGSFSVVTSASSPTYQWQYLAPSGSSYANIPNTPPLVTGTTSATISFTNTDIAYNGYYVRCIVTSNGCQTISNGVLLTVNTLPTPTFTAQPGVQACINTNVTYTTQTGSGINNYVWGFTGTAGTDYQIMSGGGLNDNTVTVRYLTLGNKTATVNYRNSNNCYAAAAATSTATNITPTSAGGTVSGSHILCSGNAPLSSLISGGGRIGNVVRWERSTNTSFSPLTTIANNTDTLTSAEIGALTVTTYFRAIAVSGSCSEAASTYATITVPVAPAVPTAQAVSNVTCSQVQANWTAATNAASYVLEVASDNAFATLVYNQNVGNNLSQTVTGLAAGTYYYRVYAENTCSNRGGNSGTITFNTTATLAPLATAATPNCTGFVAFWNSVSGATDYRLDVSTSNTFSSFVTNGNGTVLNGATVSGLTYAVTGLVPGTTYYYRVRANNVTCGDSANSNTITITAGSPTTATWDGLAWSPAPPTFADNILFTGDYISTVDLNGCSCIVNNDADIVISSDNTLTLTHTVNVATGSTMTFENNASLLQNTDAQNTGLIKYKRITTPIYKFDFTFWSSPVQGFTLEKLSPSTLSDKYQGYDGANSKWTTLSRTLTMSPGTAYNIRGPQGHATPAPYLATFEGTPNNGPYELTGLVAGKFYLAGNPYPSPINVLDFLDLNEDIIEGTIYFWTHATPIAPNGSVYSYGSDDYASRNYLGGTAAQPDGRIPSDYISAAQGFFMKTITTDPVRFTNDMRVSTAEGENAQFFKPGKTAKTAATSKRSRVWLSISNGLGAYKQTLLGYAEGASNSYDSKYDGVSFSANKNLNLYTLNEDKKFAIQGRAYPVQETDVVPLGYVANLEGEFSIAIDKTDGTLASQAIYLEDKLTGTIYDLKASKYTFTTAKGTFNDRFVLRYTKKTLGNDDFENVEGGLVVTVKDKVIKVTSASESIQSVTIFDLTGKLLFNKQKIEATEFAIPNLHSSEQTLLVKVGLENGTTATRKIIFN